MEKAMKRMKRSLVLLTCLIVVALPVVFAAYQGSHTLAQNPQCSAEDPDVPLVDFSSADNPATKQKQKARKRGLSVSLRKDEAIAELPAGVEPLPFSGHLWARLPPLPVAQSNAVVLGEIIGRRAVLTHANLGIYSEFSIKLVKIFKDDQGVLRVGGSVEASRLGGAVRFPSGKIQRYTVSRQGYPELGKQYVLFLKRDEEGDFSIVTGYDVSSPGVTPLDGDARQPRGDLQFGIYRGMAKDSFLTELQVAMTANMGGGE
jgi:hypothetical protein